MRVSQFPKTKQGRRRCGSGLKGGTIHHHAPISPINSRGNPRSCARGSPERRASCGNSGAELLIRLLKLRGRGQWSVVRVVAAMRNVRLRVRVIVQVRVRVG